MSQKLWKLVQSTVCFVVVVLILVALSFMEIYPGSNIQQPLPNAVPRTHATVSGSTTRFPKLLHYMWKSAAVAPPSETIRWQKGCKAVNPDHEIRMYYDADLLQFVQKEYPQYLPLFRALKGVYMADMARVLVIYHFGGVYMDLDFYCHRPFTCIAESILPTEVLEREKDILVVSLEPAVHANIFRDKQRVVIQDFYMATPKHPFFRWFLDNRMQQYERDPQHPAKGPFSYSIEVDIDAYKKEIAAAAVTPGAMTDKGIHGNSTGTRTSDKDAKDKGRDQGSRYGYIYELPEDVLHSLVDNTNPRLDVVCLGSGAGSKSKGSNNNRAAAGNASDSDSKSNGKSNGASGRAVSVPPWAVESCEKVRQRQYFSPSQRTIAVHMWTHTFLGWSFFRGWYNSAVYQRVAAALPPTMRCPDRATASHALPLVLG